MFDKSPNIHFVQSDSAVFADYEMNSASFKCPLETSYRSIFISDVHLGTRGCRSDILVDFLSRCSCQHLFLVGDIIDGWHLRKSWFWDSSHGEVLRQLLRHARRGVQITYIPGGHDEMLRAWLDVGLEVAGIRLRKEAVHVTAHGKRLLVIHGDEFDSVVRYARFLALFGEGAYSLTLTVSQWFDALRYRLGYPYWSLSTCLRRQVREVVKAVDRFESALADEARRRGLDGVICGHIHHAEMREVGDVLYLDAGDWVESCTALVEHHNGSLELIDWAALNRLSFFASRRPGLPHTLQQAIG